MKCHEARAGLPHYLNDELSASERALLQAHLAECEACFAELQTVNALQHQVRAGLHLATQHAEPAVQGWAKLHTTLQSRRTEKQNPRPAFFVRAVGAAFATLSFMVAAVVLQPVLMGNLAPASEATSSAPTQPTQQAARSPATVLDPNHKQLAAFLKTEPYQSVQTAIAALSEVDAYVLNDVTCRTRPCVPMK